MSIVRNLAVLGLAIGGVNAALATTIIYNPKVISSTAVNTGIEARFQFAPNGRYDSSVSGTYNLGNVGPTEQISNNVADLVNVPYNFKLNFETGTGKLTWSVMGGPLSQPSVLIDKEVDSFNSLRFNGRSMNVNHTLKWSNLAFTAAGITKTIGTWPSSGSTTNKVTFQRMAAGPGQLLSTFDWQMTGTVETNGVAGSQVKIWIASHMIQLKPGVYSASSPTIDTSSIAPMSLAAPVSAVPEVSGLGLMSLGLLGLALYRRRTR